jgi:hypothetical protein
MPGCRPSYAPCSPVNVEGRASERQGATLDQAGRCDDRATPTVPRLRRARGGRRLTLPRLHAATRGEAREHRRAVRLGLGADLRARPETRRLRMPVAATGLHRARDDCGSRHPEGARRGGDARQLAGFLPALQQREGHTMTCHAARYDWFIAGIGSRAAQPSKPFFFSTDPSNPNPVAARGFGRVCDNERGEQDV